MSAETREYRPQRQVMSAPEAERIGSGSFGYVVRPAVECLGHRQPRFITKLERVVGKLFRSVEDDGELKSEMVLSARIHSLDPRGRFTITSIGKCSLDADRHRSLIQSLPDLPQDTRRMTQLVYPDGGESLIAYAESGRGDMANIILHMTPIIRGLTTLKKHQLAHFDIKPDNMVINRQGRIYLIDFGHLTDFNGVYRAPGADKREFRYAYYPPDFSVSTTTDVNQTNIGDLFEIMKLLNGHDYELLHRLIYRDVERHLTDAQAVYLSDMELFKQRSIETIDLYGIGVSLIELIGKIRSGEDNHDALLTWCAHAAHPNVMRRATVEEAIKEWSAVLEATRLTRPTIRLVKNKKVTLST